MKIWKKVLVGLALVVLSVGAVIAHRIGPRNIIGMLRYDQRREGDLKPGDSAPDVLLYQLDGQTHVRLADSIGGRPTVLVFGSFT